MAVVTNRIRSGKALDLKPLRVKLISNPGLENEEEYVALLNPTKLRESIQVAWSKLPVVGLDYEVPQYNRTHSLVIPMTFYFSAFEAARQFNIDDPFATMNSLLIDFPQSKLFSQSMDFVNFMRSLCFPTRNELRPPIVKVIWPNVFSFLAVVETVNFDYIKFDRSLAPLTYSAEVQFLEVRFSRRFSEVVRQIGLVADNNSLGNEQDINS